MKKDLKFSPFLTISAIATISVCFMFAFGFFGFLGCGGKKIASSSEVLATFDWPEKQFIKAGDLDKEINELPEYKRDQYQEKKGKEEYLTLMSESRMLLAIAKKNGLDKDPEINKKVDEYLNQLLVERLTEAEVDKKALANISDADLQKYYDEHIKDHIDPERVKLTCITVTDKKKADEIYSRLKGGEEITKVAKEISDKGENVGPGGGRGGDTGFFSRQDYGSSTPNFVEAAFSTQKGQLSEIVEQEVRNSVYYMIFRAEDRQAERQKTFDEVKDEVRREIESLKKETRKNEWMKDLKSRSKLQLFPERIPKSPEEEKTETETETKPENEPEHEHE